MKKRLIVHLLILLAVIIIVNGVGFSILNLVMTPLTNEAVASQMESSNRSIFGTIYAQNNPVRWILIILNCGFFGLAIGKTYRLLKLIDKENKDKEGGAK